MLYKYKSTLKGKLGRVIAAHQAALENSPGNYF
jgi:hypothetical protein